MNISSTTLLLSIVATLFVATGCNKAKWNCVKAKGDITTENRAVESYRNIELDIAANVFLTQDANQDHTVRVEAPADILEHIETVVRGNTLRIDSKRCYNTSEAINIYLSFRDLDDVDLNGSGTIVGRTEIVTNRLQMTIDGSGDVDLDLAVTDLTSNINGSGDFSLLGTATNHSINIDGSGSVKAYPLAATNTDIKINGSGNCQVDVANQLNVRIAGSGDVFYRGNPSVSSSVSGSGDLTSTN